MKLEQRVGLLGKVTYSFVPPTFVQVSYRSPIRTIERKIDLRLLNPNQIREKVVAVRVIVLGVVFAFLAFVWGSYGIMGAMTIGGRIGFSFVGVACLTVSAYSFFIAYLRSREVRAFMHLFSSRAEIVLHIEKKTRASVEAFAQEVNRQILAIHKQTPPEKPASPSQPLH